MGSVLLDHCSAIIMPQCADPASAAAAQIVGALLLEQVFLLTHVASSAGQH